MSKTIRVEARLKPGEDSGRLVNRFLKKCKKARVVEQFREGRFYVSPAEKRQRKLKNKRIVLRKLRTGGFIRRKNNFL
jgi:ribosomal protein S21